MTTGDYVYDQAWKSERERLAGIEALWDPGSRHVIAGLGIGPGARVLEVGGGGGSLAEWLCAEVSPGGAVVATDIDTRFLEAIDHEALEVLTHDITSEPLPGTFDLIHTRMVLEHLSQRDAVLDKFVAALNPGGWLVVEDYDWASYQLEPASDLMQTATETILAFMADNGYDASFALRLPRLLGDRGLADVRADGRLRVITLDDPGAAFFTLTLEALAPVLVEQGRFAAGVAEAVLADLRTPGRFLATPTLVAAVGRKPV